VQASDKPQWLSKNGCTGSVGLSQLPCQPALLHTEVTYAGLHRVATQITLPGMQPQGVGPERPSRPLQAIMKTAVETHGTQGAAALGGVLLAPQLQSARLPASSGDLHLVPRPRGAFSDLVAVPVDRFVWSFWQQVFAVHQNGYTSCKSWDFLFSSGNRGEFADAKQPFRWWLWLMRICALVRCAGWVHSWRRTRWRCV
jgi:hypothetical protein